MRSPSSRSTTVNDFSNGVAAGPDGNIWFTGYNFDRAMTYIGMISPTTHSFTEFALHSVNLGNGTPEGSPRAPTATSGSPTRTPTRSGRSTRRRTPSPSSPFQPPAPSAGDHAGPDGNLWFTEAGAGTDRDDQSDDPRHHRIRRAHRPVLSRSEGSRRAPTATSGLPSQADRRPDRRDQPDDPRDHRVRHPHRRFRPLGSRRVPTATSGSPRQSATRSVRSTRRPTPSPSSPFPTTRLGPYGITTGPDGNIWFTDSGNHRDRRRHPQQRRTSR